MCWWEESQCTYFLVNKCLCFACSIRTFHICTYNTESERGDLSIKTYQRKYTSKWFRRGFNGKVNLYSMLFFRMNSSVQASYITIFYFFTCLYTCFVFSCRSSSRVTFSFVAMYNFSSSSLIITTSHNSKQWVTRYHTKIKRKYLPLLMKSLVLVYQELFLNSCVVTNE